MAEQENESIVYQSSQNQYAINGYHDQEIENIPLSANQQEFIDENQKELYRKALFQNAEGTNLSEEFQRSLLLFYIFYLGYLLIGLVTAISFESEGQQSIEWMTVYIAFQVILSAYSIGILLLLSKKPHLSIWAPEFYCSLFMITILYVIFADAQIFAGMVGFEYDNDFPASSLVIISLIVMLKQVIFSFFWHFLISSLASMILFLICQVTLTNISIHGVACEFFYMAIFITVLIFQTQQEDWRCRQLFFRRMNEGTKKQEQTMIEENEIQSEQELLAKKCDIAIQLIKKVCDIIIFLETKDLMKNAIKQIQDIKKGIGNLNINNQVHIQPNANMDDDIRMFLAHHFSNVNESQAYQIPQKPSTIAHALQKQAPNDYSFTEIEPVLEGIGKNWNFDIWFIYNTVQQSVSVVGKFIMRKYQFNDVFDIEEALSDNFFMDLEKQYQQDNPYHNACHGADVMHTFLFFLQQSDISKYINSMDLFASLVASLAHDVAHPGVTNRFLVNSRHKLAIRYNDNSVLENMHIATTYKLMQQPQNNFMVNFLEGDWIRFRKIVVEMILSTDLSKHFGMLGAFRTAEMDVSDLANENEAQLLTVLCMGLKCSDVGHSSKPTDLHVNWSKLVRDEFFSQGDLEKQMNLDVSMFCDRETTDFDKSQVGFIENICLPLYEAWCNFLNSECITRSCLDQLHRNKKYWEKRGRIRRNSVIDSTPSFKNSDQKKALQKLKKNLKGNDMIKSNNIDFKR